MAPLWLAEDSEWAPEGGGHCFGKALGVDDEDDGWTKRSLGCEVQMALLGDGPTEDLLSLMTQQQGRSSWGMGRLQGLRPKT